MWPKCGLFVNSRNLCPVGVGLRRAELVQFKTEIIELKFGKRSSGLISRNTAARDDLHARFDSQILRDALHNHPQVARGGVSIAVQHSVKRLFTQRRLPR